MARKTQYHATDRSQRALDEPHHVADGHLLRLHSQQVAAGLAATRFHEPSLLQFAEDDLEESDRDRLGLGDVGDPDRSVALLLCQLKERAQSVLALL